MKYVSFSLWGTIPKYVVGAKKNVELVRSIYGEGWKAIVYHDASVPGQSVRLLRDKGAVTVDMRDNKFCPPCMWRFLVNDILDCELWISRDTDSRITRREQIATKQWIDSDKAVQIIRDHPNHGIFPMQAGMIGMKRGFIKNMGELILCYKNRDTGYGHDQRFLEAVIWPSAKHNCLQQGRCSKFFPGVVELPPLTDGRFIGERLDENDVPNAEDLRSRK